MTPTKLRTPDVLVVIPARDEADRIVACLDAIIAASAGQRRVHIVVVDNDSRDDTAIRAAERLRISGMPHLIVRSAATTLGRVRHDGVLAACDAGLVDDPGHTWLLSTDADSLVPAGWIDCYLGHARSGIVAVAGVVELIPDDDSAPLVQRWWRDYGGTLAQDHTHPHVHAANLGLRLDVYLRADGFPDVDRAEDRRLWEAIRARGATPRSDATLVVATSARADFRHAGGFGAALAHLYPGDGG